MTSEYQNHKYRPHISRGGGMTQGYKFTVCPSCGRQGVSSRIISTKGKGLIRLVCRYCLWIQGINKGANP